MSLDPNKTYLEWNGNEFPNSTDAKFKAPAGSTIDWGDGVVESFSTTSTTVTTHTYTDELSEHTIVISGLTSITDSAFLDCTGLTSISVGNSVTSIGRLALSGTGLKNITIPDSVTSIGELAFSDCSELTSVDIPDSVTTVGGGVFHSCSNLRYVKLSNQITSLPDGPTIAGLVGTERGFFGDCNNLITITIPSNITSIGKSAFSNCFRLIEVKNLSSLTITAGSKGNGYVGYYAKRVYTEGESYLSTDENGNVIYDDGTDRILVSYPGTETDLTLPSDITQINQHAFYRCKNLISITIPSNVTNIGNAAFSNCSSLTSVYITDIAAWCNISFGDSYANPFMFAHNLYLNNQLVTELVIPDSVTRISSYAFENCTSLTSITIPNSVTDIGSYAFYNCRGLTSITIPDSVTSIGEDAFYNCSSLTDVTIPDSVTSIGNYAFSRCTSLTSIIIPDSVTSIGAYTFYYCTSLTSITIGNGVTSIGNNAFQNCTSLTSITIGNGVTSINNRAFSACSNLKTIILFPETPPTLGSFAIPSTTTIYVSQSSKRAYKAATNWSSFADKIESNNIYLSFVQFNIRNKEYIEQKIIKVKDYTDNNAASSLEFVIDNSTFILTATLKNANGEVLGTPQTVDLPLESVVVNGSYDGATKSIILTLQNGSTVNIPVADLIDGLASKAELDKKLDKLTPDPTYSLVPIINTNGTEGSYPVTPNAVPDTIPNRDSNGCFKVSSPVDSTDVANKNYVDNSLPSVISEEMADSLF